MSNSWNLTENISVNRVYELIDPLGSTMDIRFNRSMDQSTSPILILVNCCKVSFPNMNHGLT